jgi:hypothetical protein
MRMGLRRNRRNSRSTIAQVLCIKPRIPVSGHLVTRQWIEHAGIT